MAANDNGDAYVCDCNKLCKGVPTILKKTAYYEHRRYRIPVAPPISLTQPGGNKRTAENDAVPGDASKRQRTLPVDPDWCIDGPQGDIPKPLNLHAAQAPQQNENDLDMDVDHNFDFPPDQDPAQDDSAPAPGAGFQAALDDLDLAAGLQDTDEGSSALDRLATEIERLEIEQRGRRQTAIDEEEAEEDGDDADGIWQGPLPDPNRSRAPSPAVDQERERRSRSPSEPLPPRRPQPTRFPLSHVPEVLMAQKYLELLDSACLDIERYSGLDAQDRHDLRNPSHERLDISDPTKRLSLNMYTACRNSGGVKTYTEIASGIQAVYPEIPILSFYQVKKLVAKESGIRTITSDMCKSSCIAFTGYLAGDEHKVCPVCNAPRWDPFELERSGKKVPRQTFDTNLIGFSIQAQFGTEGHAEAAAYRRHEHERLMPEYDEQAFVSMVGDYPSGTAVLDADIPKDDICLMWTGDGFQLWELKQSDCYIYLWIMLDLPPDLRYKKEYVIPGAIIPGPNKPQNLDSFLFPGLYHVAALKHEGLRIWNAAQKREYTSQIHVLFVTADTVALPEANGMVGHMGKEGCRRYCGFTGRRKPGSHSYTYALYKPNDSDDSGSNGPAWDLTRDPETTEDASDRYYRNLERVCKAAPGNEYETARRDTGLSKPSLFSALSCPLGIPAMFPSDLMHWAALNFTALFLELWLGKMKVDAKRGDNKATWAWVFLVGEIFKRHGQDVANCLPYLPGSFERPPRNPFEKINSGYKAWEFLIWFYGMAPALLHGIMPEPFYTHFCKAAAAVRILHQREATLQDLLLAYRLMNEVCAEFETIYCEHKTSRLHFVRHAVHIATHMARDAIRHGMGSYLSQWVCERTIGLYTSLVRQPSNPYHNLSSQVMLQAQLHGLYARAPELDPRPSPESQIPDSAVCLPRGYVLLHTKERSKSRVSPEQRIAIADYYERNECHLDAGWHGRVRRYNRLLLPNGQYARSAWRESVKELHKLRISRNVKMLENNKITFGEVLFYFRLKVNGKTRTVAMVHMYGHPDADLMRDTYGTYYSCEQLPILEHGSLVVVNYTAVQSVVAMIPRADRFFLVEKITLGAGSLGGIIEQPQPEPVDV